MDFQTSRQMKRNNIHVGHVKSISLFYLSKDKELKEAVSRKKTQLLLKATIFC